MFDNTESQVLYVEDFQHLISNGQGRQIKVVCPFCHNARTNKRDRSLSIHTETLAYHCHYCGAKGYLKSRTENFLKEHTIRMKPQKKTYTRPPQKNLDEKSHFSASFMEYINSRGISEKTLIEARVTQEVEFIPQIKQKAGCIAFNYYLEEELINTKFRTRGKDFKLISGAQLIPYNINSISEEKYGEDEERYAIITEGEFDALTYIECGYSHVVSMPNGANSNTEWLDDFIESHFDKLDVIYISSDNDRKGIEARDELIRRFGKENCRIIEYPKDCKDINEVLVKHGRDAVCSCFDNYIEQEMDGVLNLYDVEESLDTLFRKGLENGATLGIPNLDGILSFQTGMLNVVTGVPSHGKTYMLNYIIVRLNILHGWKTAIFSHEFVPVSLHASQIIETLGGKRFNSNNYNLQVYEKMKEYVSNNFFWLDPNDTDINSVLDRARYLIKKKGIKSLVIDPFNSLRDKERRNAKQDEYISEFLQNIREFARKYNVSVFLVMHPTKLNKLENGLYPVCDLYNCKGASEIYDKADIGLTVWRNEKEEYAELHITKIKFRHLGSKGYATFKFNLNNGRYVPIDDAEVLRRGGCDIKSLQAEWDNSNYVLDKLQPIQVESTMIGYDEQERQQHQTQYDMPFEPPTDDAPF